MRARLVFGHNPGPFTGHGSNSWLVPGVVPTLIDAGSGAIGHVEELGAALADEGVVTDALAQVLVTHVHPDHAAGAPAVADRCPRAVFAKFPWPERDGGIGVPWKPLADDQVVSAGDGHVHVIHTPGHSPDHVCFFEPYCGTLFAGDLVMNGGTVVIPASRGGSLRAYLASLRRVLELQPRRIYPGHGAVVDAPAALIRGYIAHRLGRERQVVDALAAGPLPIVDIVAKVYDRLDSALAPAAGDNVLAHLRKLEEEGRARPDDEGDADSVAWRLTGGG